MEEEEATYNVHTASKCLQGRICPEKGLKGHLIHLWQGI